MAHQPGTHDVRLQVRAQPDVALPCSQGQERHPGQGLVLTPLAGPQSMAASAGLRVSELIVESTVDAAIVSANWRKNWPVIPEMNAQGMNTAESTRPTAITGAETSLIAWIVAALGVIPCSIWCSTDSTTTIASSTTIPIASTSPKSVRLLSEKPKPP